MGKERSQGFFKYFALSLKRTMVFLHVAIVSLVILAGIVLCPSRPEAKIGEGLKLVEGQMLTLSAEKVGRRGTDNVVIAEGAVKITYRKSTLTADRIEYNEATGDAVATGHVKYVENGETITADRIELNINTELGRIFIGRVELEDDHFIEGEVIEKLEEETYVVDSGRYTACKGANPDWSFGCTSASVQQGGYLQGWNVIGYIKGIPVFYFPYFIYPVRNERQTGFLVPEIGLSTSNGFAITNAFFWAMSPSQDATLSHTYYTERGHKFELEYRYIFSETNEGELDGKFVRDTKENTVYQRLKWEHQQRLPYTINTRINANWTSDDQFDENFETRLEDRTQRKLESDVSFTRKFKNPDTTVRLIFNRLDDLRKETAEREIYRFPELQITSQQYSIPHTPLHIEQQTRISRLRREEGTNSQQFERLHFHPTLSIPVNLLGKALTLTPRVDFYETYYTRDATTAAWDPNTATGPELEAKPIHREYYQASVGLNGPKFYRDFDLGRSRRLQKLRHRIEPSLSFSYRPAMDELDVPKFDEIDKPGSSARSRSLSYGITQRLIAKQVTESAWKKFLSDDDDAEAEQTIEDLKTENRELAVWSITQSYNFEAERRHFSDITTKLTLKPIRNYTLNVTGQFDVYIESFVDTDAELKVDNIFDALDVSLRWKRKAEVKTDTDDILEIDRSLNLKTGLKLFDGTIRLAYTGYFDVDKGKRESDTIEFTYNAQCWNITTRYWQHLLNDKYDHGFHIMLDLRHIGKLVDVKG